MSNLEKVVKGLETCSAGKEHAPNDRDCTSCPYYPAGYTGCTCKPLMTDALALLKAQEPRLITNADFENKELVDSGGVMPAWIEYRHGEEWDEYNDGNDEWSLVYQFNFESEYYRCWTARPTEEQRKAVKWDD